MTRAEFRTRIWADCLDCAKTVYATRPPTEAYALAVAKMLYGTAAKESAFQYHRQTVFKWHGAGGAFSLWQVEFDTSALGSLARLASSKELREAAGEYLWPTDPNVPDDWPRMFSTRDTWQQAALLSDRFGCLFARLHYFRINEPIPATLQEQAAYWLKHYNGYGCVKVKVRDKGFTELAARQSCALEYIEAYSRAAQGIVP